MTAKYIKEIIAAELKVESDLHNVSGVDITQCLIKPVKQSYKTDNDATEMYEL